MNTDVAIIGAGAIGLALAEQLTGRGRRVTILDRDPLEVRTAESSTVGKRAALTRRRATSWAASGILPPANFAAATDPMDRLRGYSHLLFPELAERLQKETGIDCQLDRCGAWYLADTIGEIGLMAGMVAYWHELEIECEEVSLEQLVRRQPGLEPWVSKQRRARAWWVPDEYQIRCPDYLDALLAASLKRGAVPMGQSEVVGFDEHAGRVRIRVRPAGEVAGKPEFLEAKQVAVCAGAWSGRIDPELRLSESIVPVRGQILLLKFARPPFSSVINVGNRYLVPRRDGHLLVGSCEEEVGHQHGTTPAVLSQLRQFVREVFPQASATREVAAWSGLRPMTFDGFPMCGKVPGSERLFVASGHFRSGIHLSPATAVCLAAVMCGQAPPLAMDTFRVGKQQAQPQPR